MDKQPSPDSALAISSAAMDDLIGVTSKLNGLSVILIDSNHVDKPIVYCSSEFCEQFGYSSDMVIGKSFSFMQGDDTDLASARRLEEALCKNAACAEELLLYKSNIIPIWCCVSIAPVRDDAGKLIYHFTKIVDVSQRKMDERDRVHEERLKALGALSASIGHEFNNIIQVVSHAAYAAEREAVSTKQKRNLARVVWGFEQASILASQMLSLARKQIPDTSVVDLNEIIVGFDRMISQAVRKSVKIKFELFEAPLQIQVDPAQLELALLNLVRNASDAIDGSGKIVIKTMLVDAVHDDETFVELTVADNGTGMDAFTAEHARDPFFTTKKDGKGTGLGLPMVNGFMAQSGGWLYIETCKGGGTTIRLRFRCHSPAQICGWNG